MAQSTINTYDGGLNRDIGKNKYAPNQYWDAKNIRLLTNNGLTTGNVASETGMDLSMYLPSSTNKIYRVTVTPAYSNRIVINGGIYDFVSNTLAFSYESLTTALRIRYAQHITAGDYNIFNNSDSILIVGLNIPITVAGNNITPVVEIGVQTSFAVVGTTKLRDYLVIFTKSESSNQIWKVRINPTTGKPIVSNGTRLLPSEHLAYNANLNFSLNNRIYAKGYYETPEVGKVYFTDNNNLFRHFNIFDSNSLGIPTNRLEIVPDATFAPIDIKEIIPGGNYKAGMIQYSYALYNLHGAQSPYSPLSKLAHLAPDSETANSSAFYKGVSQGTQVNKAVRVYVNGLDKKFTHVKLLALHFESLESTPSINIVYEGPVPESGSINVTDTGDSLGTITLSDFVSLGTLNFKCKTFEMKDNMLFVGNITEDFYDVDFDARAYRFKSNQQAKLNSSTGTSFTIGTDFLNITTDEPVPEIHDCIQTKAMQMKTGTGDYGYSFQADGTTTGGEGPNVKYGFAMRANIIDAAGIGAGGHTQELYTQADTNPSNPSFTNNASPTIHMDVGYMRGEVYRFGIIFRNEKGHPSFVKWVGDIKIPEMYEPIADVPETTYKSFYYDGGTNKIYGNTLYLTFELKSVPQDAVAWQVVRVERKEDDKSILAQGFWSTMILKDLNPEGQADNVYINNLSIQGVQHYIDGVSQESLRLPDSPIGYAHSPEISFKKNIKYEAGMKVQVLGTGVKSFESGGAKNIENPESQIHKIYDYHLNYTHNLTVHDAQFILAGRDRHIVDGNYSVMQYCYDTFVLSADMWGDGNSALVMRLDQDIVYGHDDEAYDDEPRLVNIYRDGHIGYGGNTYVARTFNTYMPCTPIIPITTHTANVFGGDTYVEMFEGIHSQHDIYADQHYSSFFFVPVETTICLPLRHDMCWSRLYANRGELHEYHGTYGSGQGYFVQGYDYYLYNTVYSRQSNVSTLIAKPLNFSSNRIFDTRVLVAMPKTINEEIDNWTRFLPNTFRDVDGSCGQINNLIVFEDKLMFLQDSGLGILAVNDKVLTVPDETGTSMTLGKGGLLDDHQYVTRRSGCTHRFGCLVSGIARDVLYYYDNINNEIMMYNISGRTYARNQTVPLTSVRGIKSLLNDNPRDSYTLDSTLTGYGMHMEADPNNKRIYFTFLCRSHPVSKVDYGFTVAFNELAQTFESFYSFLPSWYLPINNCLLSQDNFRTNGIYVHNRGAVGYFYGVYYNSSITILVNPIPTESKIFANLEYNLNVTNSSKQDLPERNFDYIRVYNEYQDTGLKPLMFGVNSRRRFRVWHVTIPRASTNFQDRVRSQEVRIEFTFLNGNNETFILEDVKTLYVVKPL